MPTGVPHGPGDRPCLLGLLRGSAVVEEDEGGHGHGQVGPAHATLAAEEQRRGGSAGVPQQEAGALLGGKEVGPKELQKANPSTPNPRRSGAFPRLTLRKRMKASKCSSSGAPWAGRGRRW